jgi:hypothetical protein
MVKNEVVPVFRHRIHADILYIASLESETRWRNLWEINQ